MSRIWVLFAQCQLRNSAVRGAHSRLVDLEGSGNCVSVLLEAGDDLVDIFALERPFQQTQASDYSTGTTIQLLL